MSTTQQFHFEPTQDGSPTARIGSGPLQASTEAMHSLKGAFSETVYIYGAALEKSASDRFEPRVLSMGLGLGYVELLATAVALRENRKVAGESFEIIPELRTYFTAWLKGSEVLPDFKTTYDEINQRTAAEIPGATPDQIRESLAQAIRSGSWLIRDALTSETEFTSPFGCICFDAFSSKSTPDLWTEEFLKAFLQKTAAPEAVLSTYACTGALKRALRAEQFEITIREGFSSKRDSTFAVRKAAAVSN